jgi:hypothetical protein
MTSMIITDALFRFDWFAGKWAKKCHGLGVLHVHATIAPN